MEFLAELWLPILLASIAVILAGNIIYMLLPYHRKDFKRLPDEESIRAAIKAQNLERAQYAIPYAVPHEAVDREALQEKFDAGPVGTLVIGRNGNTMTRQLIQYVVFVLALSIAIAYVAFTTLSGNESGFWEIFRVTGIVAFLAHGGAHFFHSIVFHQPWGVTLRYVMDAMVYALLTAGFFAWLW